jgi:CRISPR-associated protein Csb2
MGTLTIGWEYLTGYAVATDPSNRERAEWPPHPARVFMALAAAWFETGQEEDEGAALRWLEELDGEPELHVPPSEPSSERSMVTVYVPVNDKAGPSAASIQSAPALTRSKQPRGFPRIWLGYEPCYLHWPEAGGAEQHHDALDRLCRKVTRIGHSSSLVRMWADEAPPTAAESRESWVAGEALSEVQARQTSPGMLEMLQHCYGAEPRQRHAELTGRIAELKTCRKQIKGKGATERKAAIDAEVAELSDELSRIVDRPPVRPSIGLWSGYRRAEQRLLLNEVPHTHFDTDVLVLTHDDGPQLPLVATLSVTRALRGKILKHVAEQTTREGIPPWISGHDSNGDPSQDENGHLALIPLPFVGREHADAHLLGMGLAFPRNISREARGRTLGALMVDDELQSKPIELKLGRLGLWTLRKRDWSETRHALKPETWTAHPKGARTWASVTPVVLDRFPKQDRLRDRAAWTAEVADIVRQACGRIGLPDPVAVDVDTTSWQVGCARAVSKRRRLRGQEPAGMEHTAPLGEGFPAYPAKGDAGPRPQVHVWLEFAEPVLGPILLGAGRYRGYGLLRPRKGGQ